MAESKTARASRVTIGEAKKDPFDTPEKKIAELRKQRKDKLFVNRMDFVDALLAAYDAAVKQTEADLFAMKKIIEARDEIVAQRNELEEKHAAAQKVNASLISQIQEMENARLRNEAERAF